MSPGRPDITPFVIRRFSSDMNVFGSVFLDRELEESLPENPGFVIDGGANVGDTTAFYARHYPGATVIAVEPSRSNLDQRRRNCSGFTNIVDLEGTEAALFGSHSEQWLAKVGAIAVEIHGEEARSAIDRACPPGMFGRTESGEKVFLARRP